MRLAGSIFHQSCLPRRWPLMNPSGCEKHLFLAGNQRVSALRHLWGESEKSSRNQIIGEVVQKHLVELDFSDDQQTTVFRKSPIDIGKPYCQVPTHAVGLARAKMTRSSVRPLPLCNSRSGTTTALRRISRLPFATSCAARATGLAIRSESAKGTWPLTDHGRRRLSPVMSLRACPRCASETP